MPVDTHVWDIAVRDYAPSLKDAKSLTPAVYNQVGDAFRTVFPHKAGWAHSVLFAAELPDFRQLLPQCMQDDMSQFSAELKVKKMEKKNLKKRKIATLDTNTQHSTTSTYDVAVAAVDTKGQLSADEIGRNVTDVPSVLMGRKVKKANERRRLEPVR